MNIFSIAGSKSQAVAEVLNATKTEKIAANIILFINLKPLKIIGSNLMLNIVFYITIVTLK